MSRANKLREILNERGIKAVWLADRVGMSKSALNEILHERREPTLTNARKIARVLGCEIGEIWPED